MERQQRLNYSRSQQLGLIERVHVPKLGKLTPDSDRSIRASPAACKNVLRAIDSYGRGGAGWPSQSTIAIETGLSKRQVATAIARLKYMGLLAIDKRKLPNGLVGNLYSIVWSELAVRKHPKLPKQPIQQPTVMQSPHDRDAVAAERDAVAAERDAVTAYKPPISANEAPPTVGLVEEFEKSLLPSARLFHEAGVMLPIAKRIGLLVDPGQADQIVRTYMDKRNRFESPGAIAWRVENGAWPARGVVEALTRDQLRQAKAAADRKRTRAEAEAARLQASRAAEQKLEREVGHRWDCLSEEDREKFAREKLDDWAFSNWRRCPELYRQEFLADFARESNRQSGVS